MTRAFMCALLFTAAPLAAQESSSLVGTWRVTFPVMMKMENGVITPTMGDGTLTISSSGDSLIGKLETDSIPDTPPRPVLQLSGKPAGNTVSLMARGKATLSLNGGATQREAVSISTWAVTAAGDSLTGTLDRRMEGMSLSTGGPQPVKGSRKRG